jgi:hypothetical protein
MNNDVNEEDDERNDPYLAIVAEINRPEELDQRVIAHELGHLLIDRSTGNDSISFISVTPQGGYEGICCGTLREAFATGGKTGGGYVDASTVREIIAPQMPVEGEDRGSKSDVLLRTCYRHAAFGVAAGLRGAECCAPTAGALLRDCLAIPPEQIALGLQRGVVAECCLLHRFWNQHDGFEQVRSRRKPVVDKRLDRLFAVSGFDRIVKRDERVLDDWRSLVC